MADKNPRKKKTKKPGGSQETPASSSSSTTALTPLVRRTAPRARSVSTPPVETTASLTTQSALTPVETTTPSIPPVEITATLRTQSASTPIKTAVTPLTTAASTPPIQTAPFLLPEIVCTPPAQTGPSSIQVESTTPSETASLLLTQTSSTSSDQVVSSPLAQVAPTPSIQTSPSSLAQIASTTLGNVEVIETPPNEAANSEISTLDREKEVVRKLASDLFHVRRCWHARHDWKDKRYVRNPLDRHDITRLECPYPDCERFRGTMIHAHICQAPPGTCIIDLCHSYTTLVAHWATCRQRACYKCQIRVEFEREERRREAEVHREPVRAVTSSQGPPIEHGPLVLECTESEPLVPGRAGSQPLILEFKSDLDKFVNDQYKLEQKAPFYTLLGVENWRTDVSIDDRTFIMSLLLAAILPGVAINAIDDRRIQHVIAYVCHSELETLYNSSDVSDYMTTMMVKIMQTSTEFREFCLRQDSMASSRHEIPGPSERQSTFICTMCCEDMAVRYRCDECDNFEICQKCYARYRHPHRLQRFDFDMRNQPSAVFTQSIFQLSRHIRLEFCVKQLMKASRCVHPHCGDIACIKYRDLVTHARTCKLPRDVICLACQHITGLCRYHSRRCTNDHCPVPFCIYIRRAEDQLEEEDVYVYDAEMLANRLRALYVSEGLLHAPVAPIRISRASSHRPHSEQSLYRQYGLVPIQEPHPPQPFDPNQFTGPPLRYVPPLQQPPPEMQSQNLQFGGPLRLPPQPQDMQFVAQLPQQLLPQQLPPHNMQFVDQPPQEAPPVVQQPQNLQLMGPPLQYAFPPGQQPPDQQPQNPPPPPQ